MKHILFTGGGSAGHVVPNLALMRELRYRYVLSYMGTGGIEKGLVTEAGYPYFTVETPKLVRSFCAQNFSIPKRLRAAKAQALAIVRKEKPDLVFSKGGYASYPAVWAAKKLNIPVLTHESDLSPGLCTRLIAKKCAYVLTSFPETAKRFPNGLYTGSPIRRELLCADRQRALHKLGLTEKFPVLLVFGGGSGSETLSRALGEALPRLTQKFCVFHITGAHNKPLALNLQNYLSAPYVSDMGSAYAAADVVLCRAGSNTVFEVVALKKPAVLVPLERGSRGDQTENARYFEQRGLVKVLREENLSSLADVVENAAGDKALRQNLEQCAIGSGTGAILRVIRELLEDGFCLTDDQRGGASE